MPYSARDLPTIGWACTAVVVHFSEATDRVRQLPPPHPSMMTIDLSNVSSPPPSTSTLHSNTPPRPTAVEWVIYTC